ncbi:hypothetical protein C8R43DRAFT_1234601 [Mycena crocata]|nr:hypothetical protein C8R43DRAFT_1234601 [Mycena crocata]
MPCWLLYTLYLMRRMSTFSLYGSQNSLPTTSQAKFQAQSLALSAQRLLRQYLPPEVLYSAADLRVKHAGYTDPHLSPPTACARKPSIPPRDSSQPSHVAQPSTSCYLAFCTPKAILVLEKDFLSAVVKTADDSRGQEPRLACAARERWWDDSIERKERWVRVYFEWEYMDQHAGAAMRATRISMWV